MVPTAQSLESYGCVNVYVFIYTVYLYCNFLKQFTCEPSNYVTAGDCELLDPKQE